MSGCHIPNPHKGSSFESWLEEEKIIERLENLEDFNKRCIESNPLATIEKRFKELEENFHWIKSLIGQLSEEIENKRPYKCPVCDGTTFCREGMHCVPCDRTGIVWSK